MFPSGGYYYYAVIGLQAICAIHCLRRGTQSKWLWIIIVVPVIGSLIYIYSEIINNRSFRKPNVDIGAILNPNGKLKKLEDQLRFSDTFANKVKLADAYLTAGFVTKAIELYENSLTGAFSENEHVRAQLMVAYFEQGRYAEVIAIAKKLYKLPQFARSKSHILYARALENNGQLELAENEFKLMKGRYAYFEARYQYGLFLVRSARYEDASRIFSEMLEEAPHLGNVEKRTNRDWIAKAKDELRKLPAEKIA